MASDAFFPFRDSVDAAFEAGATAVIQPGARSKIRNQSTRPTSTAWRWSSPTSATSGTSLAVSAQSKSQLVHNCTYVQ